jgi:hypothetical protein
VFLPSSRSGPARVLRPASTPDGSLEGARPLARDASRVGAHRPSHRDRRKASKRSRKGARRARASLHRLCDRLWRWPPTTNRRAGPENRTEPGAGGRWRSKGNRCTRRPPRPRATENRTRRWRKRLVAAGEYRPGAGRPLPAPSSTPTSEGDAAHLLCASGRDGEVHAEMRLRPRGDVSTYRLPGAGHFPRTASLGRCAEADLALS